MIWIRASVLYCIVGGKLLIPDSWMKASPERQVSWPASSVSVILQVCVGRWFDSRWPGRLSSQPKATTNVL